MRTLLRRLSRRLHRAPQPIPRSTGRRPRDAFLKVEGLEDRFLPSTITVTNLNDAGAGSLRAAVSQATNGDTITFASTVRGTIILTSGELALPRSVTILGPGSDLLTVSGNSASRIFEVDSGARATIYGLSLTGGALSGTFADTGAAIRVDGGGTLTLSSSTLRGNSAGDIQDSGGAIANYGTLTVTSSTLSNNTAYALGGALFNFIGATAQLSDSTIAANAAIHPGTSEGGGIENEGSLTLSGCTISGNAAGADTGGVATAGPLTLTDTIVAGNTAAGSPSDIAAFLSGTVTGSYNLIGTGGSAGLVDGMNGNQVGVADPGLGALANNGGPTPTLALVNGSPALRAGSPGGAPNVDQRGVVRVAVPSIGAFDPGATPVTLDVTNLHDSGPGSLRYEAGLGDFVGDTVVFAGNPNGTISLTTGEIPLFHRVNIQGPGAAQIAVSGNHRSRVFEVYQGATVTISGLTITNGLALNAVAGGILVDPDAYLSLSASTVSNNSSSGANVGGGGIADFGFLVLDGCTIAGNSSELGGGISAAGQTAASGLDIHNSTISGNGSAQGGGGLVIVNLLTARVDNSTFANNSTGNAGLNLGGGAIAVYSSGQIGGVVLTGTTISGNMTDGLGAGLSVDSVSSVTLDDTLVAGDELFPLNVPSDIFGTVASNSSYNLIGTGGAGGLVNSVNHNQVGVIQPLLGSLAFNGGPTQTEALQAGSPALDTGDPALAAAGTPDQRGVTRTGGVNIGAYQASASTLVLAGFPSLTPVGTLSSFLVTAVDPYGEPANGYAGTVQFSSSDPQASLPGSYTFTLADAGLHLFDGATLYTAGVQSLTVTDATTDTLTGTQAGIVVIPAAVSQFVVSTSATDLDIAGTPLDVTVTAQDAFGNTVTGYLGTIHFSSGDPFGASLPADYTFQPTDQGVAFFPAGATLFTAGTWDVTVTDTAGGQIGSAFIPVAPAAAVAFQIIAPASATSGGAFDVTVIAVDPFGNTDTNYQGTVQFSTTDPDSAVVLPPDYTFQPTDAGVVTFAGGGTLITPGDQTITVTDTVSGITGSATVTVGLS